jgi:hypothetical protein
MKMEKIKTIFERDHAGNKKVINKLIVEYDFKNATATEKVDGMNVRVTIRKNTAVRLEKRRNPSKSQKEKGIIEPWYVDAIENDPADKWLFDALKNTDLSQFPEGEWSGEAIGENIQGNPLNLKKNFILFFSLNQAPVFENVPTDYDTLRVWLPLQKSKIGNNCGIEGIVWHSEKQEMVKIKTKDFFQS